MAVVTFHHYYHVYADGAYWRDAVLEHAEALRAVDVDYQLIIGIVGAQDNRDSARTFLSSLFSSKLAIIHEFEDGWEQRTLQILRDDVSAGAVDGLVLYTHTKGSANKTHDSEPWRSCMERNVVAAWKLATSLLESNEADTVGVHWLRKQEWPDRVDIPFYGGNYWWTTTKHLKKLPAIDHSHRWGAESWLGTVVPERPADLVPGHLWPGTPCNSHRDTRTPDVKITF